MTAATKPTGGGGEVNATALAVAACRAVETTRPDALVLDPFASAFVAAASTTLDLPTRWPAPGEDVSPFQQPLLHASVYIGVRTRFIDDVMADEADVQQVVILGAGLDTRAYRLTLAHHAPFFELDDAATLEFKQGVLEAGGAQPLRERHPLPVDVSIAWDAPLRAQGFDADEPTLWIVEGLLPYLSAEAQHAVLSTIVSLSAVGSTAVIERAVPLPAGPELDEKLRAFSAQTGLPVSDLLARANPPDPVAMLREAGWVAEAHSPRELAARYGRHLGAPGAPEQEGERAERDADSSPSRGGIVVARLL
ncbi:SAM-dependent methyltransferase [Cryobacterium tepidiphilum]|uniref:S-adenosyl-L-methionine-dependent methyltransferase n=1 Tax=Cryobacterium tepidiphilum TaxID=2486026 RepID=A0A3M8KXY2_9MICO|nr:SAM-dependent methyltransferase [Cryobacterium tepidiphilum]RNE57194.1 SAM-dependent methyltransferase [Cryobacterium tepidiphilum]